MKRLFISLNSQRLRAFFILSLLLATARGSRGAEERKPVEGQADEAPPRWVDTSGPAPSDAVVVFNGGSTEKLVGPDGEPCPWPVIDGLLVCDQKTLTRRQGLWTTLHFRDAQIHAEFRIPPTEQRGEDAGNGGLYFHGLFEQQIHNSFENPIRPSATIGAVYGFHPPLVNVARRPGEWQVYDILFRAPRRDTAKGGEPIEAGQVTTLLNGVVVQINASFTKHRSVFTPLYAHPTPYALKIRESLLRTESGPLQLQNHDNAVAFRMLWIRPLDDRSFVFEAK